MTVTTLRARLAVSSDVTRPAWDPARLADELRLLGHEIDVVTVPDQGELRADDVDMVHAFGLTAGQAADRAGTAWCYTPHLEAPPGRSADPHESDDVELARAATGVAVPSTDDERIVNQAGVAHHRCHVLPLALDVETYARTGPAANRTGRSRILVEATGPSDGVIDAVQALEALPDAEVLVLVPVPKEALDDEPHLVAVRDAAEHGGVRDRVAFYHAREERERAWLLRSADVVVSVPLVDVPLLDGAEPLVLQAMGCGRPVVATPVGPARDLVVHGVTGFHVTPGDGRALVSALRLLAAEPFTADALGSAGADRALSRYSWDRVAMAFTGLWVDTSREAAGA